MRLPPIISICVIFSLKTYDVNSEVSDEQKLNILLCAKMGQLFSLLDPKHCYSPLTQGPCDTDEVIVIDQQTLLGTCIYKPCHELEWWDGERCRHMFMNSCKGSNMRRWYNLTGGTTCDCEDGWARETSGGECHQFSTQAWCPDGKLLQEIPVPRDCNCVPKDDCQSFLDDVKYLESNKKNINLERLRIRNCGEKGGEKKVCCDEPSVKTHDLSFHEIQNSFMKNHTANFGCLPNPCPEDQLPWPGYPGKCFKKSNKSETCTKLRLLHDKMQLSCSPTLVQFTVSSVPPRKCRPPKRWNTFTESCIRPIVFGRQ